VAVIGGGPAGAAAARLLADWGHDVILLTKTTTAPALAESLPPSIAKPLAAIGVAKAVRRAGFYRTYGNTVWWGDGHARSEPFAGGAHGYQVVRSAFDELLLQQAEAAGARVHRGAVVREVELSPGSPRLGVTSSTGTRTTIEARMVLDCSGRTGVVAREGGRAAARAPSTLALVGRWHHADGWEVSNDTHTLVESYVDGWAWSVPVSRTERYVAAMVDPRTTAVERSGDLERSYRRELHKTQRLSRVLERAALMTKPWARDASTHSGRQLAGPGFLLLGDAASSVDPLSSCGVKKALVSAWLGAVVTRTSLGQPDMAGLARDLFVTRETQVFEMYRRRAATFFFDVARNRPHPFWQDRADQIGHGPIDAGAEGEQTEGAVTLNEGLSLDRLRSDQSVRSAFEWLRAAPSICLRRTPATTLATRPAVKDNHVVLERCVVVEGWADVDDGLRFLRGVDLPRLIEVAETHTQVPDVFAAYQRDRPAVPLPDFLGALSVLVAKGALRDTAQRSSR